MATNLCLPVLKFSHATGVRNDGSIGWTHLSGSDICVVIKGVNTNVQDAQLSMRVIQGNSILEDVDVAAYIEKAIVTRHGSEQVGVIPQVDQLPIFGMTKESLVAIRYRLSDNQARRLQLRMQNSTQCRQIVSVFERRGMEFQEQRPRTARPGGGRTSTDLPQHRPLTTQSSSPYSGTTHNANQTNLFNLPTVEAGSLSQKSSSSPERPALATFGVGEPQTSSFPEMLPPKFFTRDEVTAPRDVVPTRPTTAQIYRSYTTPSQSSQYEAFEPERQDTGAAIERPSSTSQMAGLEAIRRAAAEHETLPQPASVMHPDVFERSQQNDHTSSGQSDPLNNILPSSDPVEAQSGYARPSTPATAVFAETLEHEIPPRRQLPFARPDSGHSESDRAISRSGTSALTLPPLPKPKTASGGSASAIHPKTSSPSQSISAVRPSTASPLKRSFVAGNDEFLRPDISRAAGSLGTTQLSSATKPHSIPPSVPSTSTSLRRPSPMEALLNSRKPLEERSTNQKVPRLSSLADAPHEIISPPNTARSPERLADVNAYAAKENDSANVSFAAARAVIRSPTRHAQEPGLEEYITQSLEDRQAALDEFMIENLENPAFTTLCEDVENCWRRIALGL